jgi:hypothetical protein
MRTALVVSLLSLCLTTLGCGDSNSGVDRDKYLDELSASEVSQICKWSIEKNGGPGEYQCSENVKVTIPSQSGCESEARPHCPVSLFEDCMIELDGDACRQFSTNPPQTCKTYFDCVASRE